MPRSVTVTPPLSVTSPPRVAVVVVTPEAAEVLTVGAVLVYKTIGSGLTAGSISLPPPVAV